MSIQTTTFPFVMAGSSADVNPSDFMIDLASRMKTFTVLKWCGMPYNVCIAF